MSCEINVAGCIVDTVQVRDYLLSQHGDTEDQSWLTKCLISNSPTEELIAFASGRRIVILTAKWNSSTNYYNFVTSCCRELSQEGDITSIYCLPIAGSQSRTSQVGPEWTCVIVGFSSGHVKFYTENCELLMSEQFHDESVVGIRCHCQPEAISGEEINVHYPSNVCVLNGNQVLTLLKSYRAQLARAQVSSEGHRSPLAYKWGFTEQAKVNGAAVIGLDICNTFDHLLTASCSGGFESRYRSSAPKNTLVMAVGSRPFVGFHFALEGGAPPVLSDLAKGVATKLINAIPSGLFGFVRPNAGPKAAEPIPPTESMCCRFGLCDTRRTADSIAVSPDRSLSAIADSLGRVFLVDNRRGMAVRLWKGYREAQLGFVQVPEEAKVKPRRLAQFLVIYCAKKGFLEIWPVQRGPRVVTFSASKFSRLIYYNHGLFGATSKSRHRGPLASCVLLDPDGKIKELKIPFFFALSEKNSDRARDLHLYKTLRGFLKSDEKDKDRILNMVRDTCSSLKTAEMKKQCLKLLTVNKSIQPEPLLSGLKCLKESSLPGDKLTILCRNIELIVSLYIFATNSPEDTSVPAKEEEKVEEKEPVATERDMKNFQKLLDLSLSNNKPSKSDLKVTFSDNALSNLADFIATFKYTEADNILLSKDCSDDRFYRTAKVLFAQYIHSMRSDLEVFKKQLVISQIRTADLIKLLLIHWINRPLEISSDLKNEMFNLSQLISVICSTVEFETICPNYGDLPVFWSDVRFILSESMRPFPALMAAIVCRMTAQRIEKMVECQGVEDDDTDSDLWESMTPDNCAWSILIGKLEDVSLLNIVVSERAVVERRVLPVLPFERNDVSLKTILQKGRGSVSVIVAQWLTTAGVDPSEEDPSPAMEKLDTLKKQFPYSLESDVLLANLAWEYARFWHVNLSQSECLDAVLRCLERMQEPALKSGLCHLLWRTHIKMFFESSCRLINKEGRLPMERLCIQETDLTDSQLTFFIAWCSRFLDIFLDAIQILNPSNALPKFRCEELWEGASGDKPLVELALEQHKSKTNVELLHSHYQLCLCVEMITALNLKSFRPIKHFFGTACVQQFFTEMLMRKHGQPTASHNVDLLMQNARSSFLKAAVISSTESVSISDNSENGPTVYAQEHIQWVSKCLELAACWGLEKDHIRKFQIVQLYKRGLDDLAEPLISTVSYRDDLGVELLHVACRRLQRIVNTSSDPQLIITALHTNLAHYIQRLGDEGCVAMGVEHISSLAKQAIRCLEERNVAKHDLAIFLMDACSTLRHIEGL